MNIQSVQAFNSGMDGLREGLAALRQSRQRKEDLKRQLEQDEFEREMKKKHMELAMNADRRAGMDQVDRAMDRSRNDFNQMLAESRQGRESDARIEADRARVNLYNTNAQTAATKPQGPIAQQVAGIDEFADAFSGAVQEQQAAIAEMQNPALQQNPAAAQTAQQRVLKATLKLQGLQKVSEAWGKKAVAEPNVELEMPSTDGQGKLKLKVPQSQWNQNHPMWQNFNQAQPAANSAPKFGPEAEGKTVRGPDGKTYVVRNGVPVAQ